MKKVTATEAKTNFGEYMDCAQREPVEVLKNGRPYVVILSQEEYARLQRQDDLYWGARAEEARAGGYVSDEETAGLLKRLQKEEAA